MATQSTHLQLYFLRTVRVRREHIQGDADNGTNGLMRIIERGQSHKIVAGQARLLIVDETCLEVKTVNKDAIDADKAEMEKQEREVAASAKSKQKAA